MQDMIAKIVEMDEKAREVTENAQKEKANTEKEITEAKQRIFQDYISRAQIRIKKNEETERGIAANKWKEIEKNHSGVLKRLNEAEKEKTEVWVAEIVKNVLVK